MSMSDLAERALAYPAVKAELDQLRELCGTMANLLKLFADDATVPHDKLDAKQLIAKYEALTK
jgi:hypothetical protein